MTVAQMARASQSLRGVHSGTPLFPNARAYNSSEASSATSGSMSSPRVCGLPQPWDLIRINTCAVAVPRTGHRSRSRIQPACPETLAELPEWAIAVELRRRRPGGARTWLPDP
jgi:hypothetical protein